MGLENKICIDIGNTIVKFAVFKGDDIIHFGNIPSLSDKIFLQTIIRDYNVGKGIVCSVSQNADNLHFLKQILTNVVFLSSKTKVSFINTYETPQTLGVDRIALVSAAVKQFPKQNVLIIDAGTCITYDFVDSFGVFQGGSISPGIQMRLKALHQFTSKLPLILEKDFDISKFVGKNTKDCILSGVFANVVCEIEGVIARYESIATPLRVVITGGDGVFLHKNIKNCTFASPYFLLQGLNAILDEQL